MLETVLKGTSQDTERIRAKEGHSRTGRMGRDKSGYGQDPAKRGALTYWRRRREEQVRIRKESNRARGTHILETASGGTSQGTERIRPGKGHSLSGDRIGWDKSGRGKNPTQRGALTFWRRRQEGQVRRNQTERGALTPWRRHREGPVRTQKESDRARGTHILETASGGTSQETEIIRPSEGHSLPGDSIGWDKSGHGMNEIQRGTLTFWRQRQEGQVRTRKESDRARGTHTLKTASGGTSQTRKEWDRARGTHTLGTASRGTSQDRERIRPSEGHSRTGHGIGMDKSGHRKNWTQRGALTNWRRH